jgi:O-antigen ligase
MNTLKLHTHSFAASAAVLLIFAAPLSRALFNTTLFLLVISCLLSPDIRKRSIEAFRYPVTKISFALLIFIFIGGLYSSAPSEFVFRQFRTYSLFLLIPVFIAVLCDRTWQKRALWAFISSMILILVLTFADVWIDIPGSSSKGLGLGKDHSIFSDYVVQSIVSAFFIAVCNHQARNSTINREKFAWLGVATLSALSVIFLLPSRTGLILLGCVLTLIVYQRFTGKYLFMASAFLLLLSTFFISQSPLALDRLNLAIYELKNIADMNNQLSFSLRFGTWIAAWDMFIQQPIFGRGTGSYAFLAASYFKDCTFLCVHPHNQYLFFLVENGLMGFSIYCAFLISLLIMASRSHLSLRHLAYCFLAILIINSFINVPFWFNREAYFFYTMTALLVAMMASSSASSTKA